MRKRLNIVVTSLLLLWAWSVASAFAQSGAGRPFITKWQGDAGKELVLPIFGTEYKLVIKNEKNEVVKSEEKITREDLKSPYTFTPDADGIYTVEAGPEGVKYVRTADFEENIIGDPEKLLTVVQFGSVVWESMECMFAGASRMSFAADIDTPDLSKVTSMRFMFLDCRDFNQPLNNWKVDNVTNMMGVFTKCFAFNQPLDNWKVDNVTNMMGMFAFTSFNQPLNEWDVSNVTKMTMMFRGCRAFNQPLDKWKVGNVTCMNYMFSGCDAFNQSLNEWDVSNVTEMNDMFSSCSSFNQPLNKWNVSKVTSMNGMFHGCHAFNQPLNEWKVDNVTEMWDMFRDCKNFNQPLDKWDVSKVTNMEEIFQGCTAFNQPLGKWKIKTRVGGLSTTAMSPSNYSQTLIGWAEQTDITNGLNFGENVKGLIYNDEGKAAREKLMGKGWTFEGDIHQSSGVSITPRSLPLAFDKEWILPLEKWGVKAATEVKAIFESKQGGAVEDALLAGIAVAPNPFTSQLRILNPEGVVARYEVVNAAGVVVRSGALSEKEVVVDTKTLPAGIYFVRLEAQNGARKSIAVSK